jgi:hypothetical protein
MARRPAKAMSSEHKAALAEGRDQGRRIRVYLEALENRRPGRGRKRSAESIQERLLRIDKEIPSADSLRRVHLIQERIDLRDELATRTGEKAFDALEADFIRVAADYSVRKGISYTAWREAGVPAAALKRAHISRSR